MKTKITKLLSVMLICALLLGLNIPVVNAISSDNLFPVMLNPETVTEGEKWDNGEAEMLWGADVADAPAAYGTDVVRIKTQNAFLTSPKIPLNKDGKLFVSFFYQAQDKYDMRVYCMEYDADGNPIAQVGDDPTVKWINDSAAAPNWTGIEQTYVKQKENAVYVAFRFRAQYSDNTAEDPDDQLYVQFAKLYCTDKIPENLINNGSFNSELTAWNPTGGADAGSANIMSENGNNFLRLENTGAQFRMQQKIADFVPGASYRITVKMRPGSDAMAEAMNTASMRLRVDYGADKVDPKYISLTRTNTKDVWQTYIEYVQLPDSATQFVLIFWNAVSNAYVDIDDVSVGKVETGYEAFFVQNGEITNKLQTGKATPLFFSQDANDVLSANIEGVGLKGDMAYKDARIAIYKNVDGKQVLAGIEKPNGRFVATSLLKSGGTNYLCGTLDSLEITDDITGIKLFIWEKGSIIPLCKSVSITR